MNPKPKVWFERAVLGGFEQEVEARVIALGPARTTTNDASSGLNEAEGVVASTLTYDASVMDRAPQLRVIARTGIGVDRVDIDAATERGIVVCNTPDGPTISTAEHAIMLMLIAAKRVKEAEAALRAGGEDFFAAHTGMELEAKTLGLVGFGRISRRVACVASAMSMHVVAFDPNLADEAFDGVERFSDLNALLAVSDVVSVHVPLLPSTCGMFGDAEFEAMKRGAVFVNTARGGLVNHAAMIRALDSGRISAVGLDVTDPEPLPPQHPLLHRNDVVVTPHVASATREAKERIFKTAVDQVIDVIEGRRPAHPVNPKILEQERLRNR